MIIVKNRELLIPNNERYIGTTYDNDTENRVFQVPRFSQRGVDLAALTFRLDIQYANESYDTVILDKEVGEAFIILIWKITSATLQVPGTLYIGIRAVDSEATVKWSSFSAAMYAERHLNTPGNYGGSLTEIEQMEQDHQYMKGVVDELKANIDYAHDAEAWAKGTRSGSAVPSTDPTYHNNSKYYSEQANTKATQAANSATAAANSATQAAETVADTNTRFNNAMAAVTSETEVIDARVGADGTTYPVLKTRLDTEHTQLKNAIGVEQSKISTTEESPYSGYWGRNVTTGIVALSVLNDTYKTLEHPIDISSLSPGVKVSLLASVNSAYGAFITDGSYHSLDYVNGGNAEEKGYTPGSVPQLVTFVVPKNAKYIMSDIRSAYYTGLSNFDVNVYDDSIIDLKSRMTEAEANIVSLDARMDKAENEIGGGEVVITPLLSTRKDGYYGRNTSTNKLGYVESTTYYTVEPIDISKLVVGTQVKMKASVTSTYGLFITDSGLNVLDYVNGSNAEEKGYVLGSTPQFVTLTVPQNAKYITSDIRNAYYHDMSDFDVTGEQKGNITILQDDVKSLSINGNVLSGKKWVACGDSFTAGAFYNSTTDDYTFEEGLYAGNYKVYPFWIGRRNPFMEVVNEAISGSTMTAGEHGVNPFSGTRYTAIPSDADYITMMFGINDSGNGCPIGTIEDTDNTTFYGAWNVVLDYLTTTFPYAHIGIIVGPGMQTSNGQQYANAEIAVAKKWGIPYLNIQFESGGGKIPLMLRTSNPDVSAVAKAACNDKQYVNPSSETPNYHPNEKAHEFESTFIESWLRTL